jgi:hypothetical protein
MGMNDVKQGLLDECLAYVKFGQDIHPIRAREMILEAYRTGYEQAIQNYCIEPSKGETNESK